MTPSTGLRTFKIFLALAFSLQAWAGTGTIAQPPGLGEYLLREGLTTATAVSALGSVFKSKADKAYLASVRRDTGKDDPVVKMKSYHQIADGYEITAPNGRSFTVTLRSQDLLVNGKKITIEGSTAERYVKDVTAALKQTYVQYIWREIDPLPKAFAVGALFQYGVLAAVVLGIGGVFWPREKPNAHTTADQMRFSNRNILNSCTDEVRENQYEKSWTKTTVDFWRDEGIIKPHVTGAPENCDELMERVKKAYTKHNLTKYQLTKEESLVACGQFRASIECGLRFEEQGRVAKIRPVSRTPEVPGSGETPSGR